eukprot:TRINITY_DN3522_c0_g1_i1.p1 TRINITY_DN3522_c0_g1~~TRINITY_DN3522_c0_g1_i1.p1  ORF type:complete len:452 (+),score=162.21 TRINITY_DN3522_c0_g1_i1:71-1426(+)
MGSPSEGLRMGSPSEGLRMGSPSEGLDLITQEARTTLQALWGQDGCRKNVRANLKSLARAQKIGAEVGKIWDEVLLMEAFNSRVWRMTGQLVLLERKTCVKWGQEEAFSFVEMVARGNEQSDAVLKKIMAGGTQAFRDNPETKEWLQSLMMPFRSAVTTQVALVLVQKAMVPGAFGSATTDLDSKQRGANPGVEFNHARSCCGGDTEQLLTYLDRFEGGKRIADGASPPGAAAVRLYLNSHLVVAKEKKGEEFLDIDGLRQAGWEQGFVPAVVAYAALASSGAKRLGGKKAGAELFRSTCASTLRASLKRDDKVGYPVAAYLLGVNACDDAERIKWHQEFLNLLDDDETRVPWAPYCGHAAAGDAYPFLGQSLEECRTAAEETLRRLLAARRSAKDRRLWWARAVTPKLAAAGRQPALFATYAVLCTLLVVLLYLNVARKLAAPADASAEL